MKKPTARRPSLKLESRHAEPLVLVDGRVNRVEARAGEHFRLHAGPRDGLSADRAEAFTPQREGDDLRIALSGGTVLVLGGYYQCSDAASACTFSLVRDGVATPLMADTMSSFQVDALLSVTPLSATAEQAPALPQFSPAAQTFQPVNPPSAPGFDYRQGVVRDAGQPAGAPVEVGPQLLIHGTVVAGPVIAGHGLSVTAYGRDGSVLASGAVGNDGVFALNVRSDYQGPVLVRVTDATPGADYRDEASNAPKDLGTDLRAVTVVAGPGTYDININPLTELAVRQLGLGGGDGGASAVDLTGVSAVRIADANRLVGDAFGLGGRDIVLGGAPVPVIGRDGTPNAGADPYGIALAAISGAEGSSGTDAVLSGLVAELSAHGLSPSGQATLLAGVAAVDGRLVDAFSEASAVSAGELRIDPVTGDNIVSGSEATAVTLTGTSPAGAAVTLEIDGVTYTAVVSGGTWSLTLPAAAVSEGFYAIKAVAAGSSASRAIWWNSSPPSPPALALAADTGVNGSDGLTRDGRVTIGGLESGATWEYTLDGTHWTAGSGSTLLLTGDGAKNLQVRQIDAAGNVGSPASLSLTLDTTAPAAPTLTLAADTGASATDGRTNDGRVVVSGLESGATWEYTLDGTNWTAGTNTTLTLTGDGAKNLRVRQTDDAGNVGTASLSLTLDTAAPAAPTLALAADTGASASDGRTSDGRVAVSGLEAGASWEYTLDGTHWTAGTGNSLTLTGDGSKNLQVRQVDDAGNAGTPASLSFTLDTTPPAAPTIDTVAGDNVIGAAEQSATISGTAEANAALVLSLGGNDRSLTADATGHWSYALQASDIAAMGQGSETLSIVATDAAGNQSTAATRGIVVDTLHAGTPPTLVGTSPADGNGAVSVASDIVLTFSEAVHAGSGSIFIRDGSGTVVRTIATGDTSQVRFDGNRMILNMASDLDPQTQYSVQVEAGAVVDVNEGAGFAGISDSTTLNFTTGRVIYATTTKGNNRSDGTGTQADPYASVGFASTLAQPGDTIYVTATGTAANPIANSYTIAANGTADSPIFIKSAPGASHPYVFTSTNGFLVTGSHVVIEGMEFYGRSDQVDHWELVTHLWGFGGSVPDNLFPSLAMGDIAVNVATGATFITVRENYFHDLSQKAVNIDGGRYINVENNIVSNVATKSLSGGHAIMRQQGSFSNFGTPDIPDTYRWDIEGNLLFNVEQRIYSWVPSKGFLNMVLDEGKSINIDETTDRQLKGRIAENIVAYSNIDAIRVKPTANLEVEHNSIYSTDPLGDGITDINTLSNTAPFNTDPFPGFKVTGNLVQTASSLFALELNDGVRSAHTFADNVILGGTSNVPGATTAAGPVFTDPTQGDFRPTAAAGGAGVSSTTLDKLASLIAAYHVTVREDTWRNDDLRMTQTMLDNIPGVSDGVAGNESVFEGPGLYADSTREAGRKALYFQIDLAWAQSVWGTSNLSAIPALDRPGTAFDGLYEIILPAEYSAWHDAKIAAYHQWNPGSSQFDGAAYTTLRYGTSTIGQNQVFDGTGLYIATLRGDANHDRISATGRTITLDGDILIDFEGYVPSPGTHSYDLISAGSIAGAFDHVRVEGLAMGFYTLSVVNGKTLRLTVSDTDPGGATQLVSPLVLDLDGGGIDSLPLSAGVAFDIDGDGQRDRVGWVDSSDAFLAYDKNGNGRIDSGRELFGNATPLSGGGLAGNGFEALAQLDGNGDGVIDAKDADFFSLKLWRDLDRDGQTDPGELKSLYEEGVVALHLDYTRDGAYEQNGNRIVEQARFERADGRTGSLVDLWLSKAEAPAAQGQPAVSYAQVIAAEAGPGEAPAASDYLSAVLAVAGSVPAGADWPQTHA